MAATHHSPPLVPDEIEALPPPRRTRAWARILGLLLVLLSVVCFSVWYAQHRLLAYGCSHLSTLLRVPLQCVNASGSLPGTLHADLIRFSSPKVVVELKGVSLRPRLSWVLGGRAVFREVAVRELSIFVLHSSGKPVQLPDSMALPVPVDIDLARIERLTYYGPGARPLQFSAIRTRARLDPLLWTLDQASGEVVGIRMQGHANMNTRRPYALAGSVDLTTIWRQQEVRARVEARGELDRTVTLEAVGHLGTAPARLKTLMTLTGAHILPSSEASVEHWPLHRWIPGLPQLDARVHATAAQLDHGWGGSIEVLNLGPGPLDKNRLPATQGAGSWTWQGSPRRLDLDELELKLPDGGSLQGHVGWNGQLDIDSRGRNIDLARFWSTLRPTRLAGTATVKTDDYHRYRVDGDLRQRNDRLRLHGSVDRDGAHAEQLLWSRGKASIRGSGRLGFRDKRGFSGAVQLSQVNPAALGHWPAGSLNGSLKASGHLRPHLDLVINAAIDSSTLYGSPLLLHGHARHAPGLLTLQQTRLQIGGLQARLDGTLGPGSSMQLAATLHGRQGWLPELSATASIDGVLSGPLLAPAFRGQLTGRDLHYRDWKVASLSGSASTESDLLDAIRRRMLPTLQAQFVAQGLSHRTLSVGRLRGNATLSGDGRAQHLALEASTLAAGKQTADELTLQLDGPLAAHQLRIELQHPRHTLTLGASGAFDVQQTLWHGRLNRLDAGGRLPLRLERQASMSIAPDRVELGGMRLLGSSGAAFEIDGLLWQPQRWSSQGRFSHLPLRDMIALGGRQPPQLDLLLAGNWNLAFDGTLNGQLRVERESGDIQPVEELQGLGLDRGMFQLKAEHNRLQAALDINSRAAGRIQGQLHTQLSERDGQLGLAGQTPLSGSLALDIPSLNWLGQWFSTPGYRFAGTLQGQVDIGGTVARPSLNGRLLGRNMAARAAAYGLDLHHGELDASIEKDRIVVERLTIQGGEGRLDGKGLLSLRENDPDISVDLSARRLAVLGRPDQKLVISGTGRAMLRDQRLAINADVKVDRGILTLKSSQDGVLDDDVILPKKRGSPGTEQKKIGIFLSAKVDLGDDFQVKHRSFNAEANGVLRMESSPQRPATLTGNVEVDKGSLYTYGQKLRLEEGSSLNFNGPPDNPAFNLTAYRDNLPLNAKTGESPRVGVNVTGTARKPVLKLISDPEMSDREKLSLLIFRQDLSNSNNKSNNQVSVLSTAATALFSEIGDGGPNLLNEAVGIDDVSVEQNTADVSKGIVRLGKQLVPNLYVSYGKGYNGASDELQLNYLFNQKWSVEIKSNENTAADLFYTISFD